MTNRHHDPLKDGLDSEDCDSPTDDHQGTNRQQRLRRRPHRIHHLRIQSADWHGTTGNFWQSAFNAVGIPVFSPVCGASAFLTMELSLDLMRAGKVFYCTEQNGGACLQCPKCLRRDVVRAVVDPGHYPQWAPYDNEVARAYLERDPLSHGHVFSFARSRVDGLPRFIGSRLKELQKIQSGWPLRVHTGTFDFCDDRWRPMIRGRVLEHLDPMRPEDIAELETWNAARRARDRSGRRFALLRRRAPRAQHGQ